MIEIDCRVEHRVGHRVGHIACRRSRADSCRRGADQSRRNADCRAPRRYFADHHGIGADASAVTDSNGAEDLGPGADHHAATQSRMTLALVPCGTAQRDAVIQSAVIADFRRLADHHTGAVIDEEAATNRCAGMNVDIGQEARDIAQPACGEAPAVLPQRVRQTMEEHRVQPRVGQQDFHARACRRIAVEDAIQVLACQGQQARFGLRCGLHFRQGQRQCREQVAAHGFAPSRASRSASVGECLRLATNNLTRRKSSRAAPSASEWPSSLMTSCTARVPECLPSTM